MAVPFSELINVRQFAEEWKDKTKENDIVKEKRINMKQYAMREMGITAEIAEELAAVCG